jgi:hypothetical protein
VTIFPVAVPPTTRGSGLPTDNGDGWIRTGFFSTGFQDGGAVTAANCKTWSSDQPVDFGVSVHLENVLFQLTDGFSVYNPIAPWIATAMSCDHVRRVWCVEDAPGQ